LAILYYGTGGEAWNDKVGWLGNGDHCEWNSITCNTRGLVTHIRLSSNNLIGAVPDLNLPALTTLVLSDNALSVIPDFNLGALEYLDLSDNDLTEVPNFNLPALTYLFLKNNDLTEVPNFNLAALRYLSLYNNDLTQVPNFNLGALTELDLYNNDLTEVPNFSNLGKLQYLNLGGNTLLTSIPQSLCDRSSSGGTVTIFASIVLTCDPE